MAALRPELVVEIRYDHVSGNRFRHGTKLMRWHPDKGAALVHLRADRAPGAAITADQTPSDVSVITQI